jgi:hypothetical protein
VFAALQLTFRNAKSLGNVANYITVPDPVEERGLASPTMHATICWLQNQAATTRRQWTGTKNAGSEPKKAETARSPMNVGETRVAKDFPRMEADKKRSKSLLNSSGQNHATNCTISEEHRPRQNTMMQ